MRSHMSALTRQQRWNARHRPSGIELSEMVAHIRDLLAHLSVCHTIRILDLPRIDAVNELSELRSDGVLSGSQHGFIVVTGLRIHLAPIIQGLQ